MSGFLAKTGLLAAAAAAAAIFYAQKRSQETGKDIVEVLGNLPAELKESGAGWQQKLMVAVDAGKQAAAAKEAEIDHQLGRQEEQSESARTADFVA